MLRTLSFVFFIASTLSLCRAQETVNNASLSGRVTDASGAVIPASTVSTRALATGQTATTTTDTGGRFRFPYLQVGEYEVIVRRSGFADARRSLTLTIGAAFDLPITLTAGATAVLTVRAEAPIIETDRSQIAATISQNEASNLPYNGRNFLDLALLAPGVSPTNTAANQLFAETSAVPGQGISISSQHNFSNSFIVDGLSANDDAAGLVQSGFGLDVIREMQVVTSGGQAEFGRALGGYINFISNSGANQVHGDVYSYLRDKQLNAANAFTETVLPYTQTQSGASLSGPIIKDRTFYFANFEYRQLNQTNTMTITPANAAQIDPVLIAANYPGRLLAISPTGITIFPNPVRSNNLFAKLDHRVSPRDQLSVRYSLYHVSSVNSRGAGGLTYSSAGANLNDLDQTVAVSNILTLSPRTVNETRGQFTNSNLLAPVVDPIGPAVAITGIATFGTLSASPTGRYDRLFEIVDNVSHQAGPHALRVGADLLFNDLTITFPMSNRGSYSFSSLTNFLAGRYSTFTQNFGNFIVPQFNPNIGFYAQDEWTITPRLTLNAGVRYDLQFLKSISTDTRNVSPRIGFAWSPRANRTTVVRGSFGLFYDRVPLRALSNALESNGNQTAITANTLATLSLSYGQTGAPVFPNIETGYTALTIPSTYRLSLSTMDPHMKNAHSEQASIELDQQLTSTSNLAIAYQHLRGLDILIDVNLNTPTCTSATDPINLCRPNSSYANNKQYYPGADSYYDSLTVSYVQRPTRFASARISYTWSHAIDDVSEFFFSAPVNNYNIGEDRSRADDDQRHRILFDTTLNSPLDPGKTFAQKFTHGFLFSGILQYYSPFPFNITSGASANTTANIQGTTLRPCLPGQLAGCALAQPGTMIGRNAGQGFPSFNVNARLSRSFPLGDRFRLQAIAEAFNALNHRNNLFPTGSYGTSCFYPAALGSIGSAPCVVPPTFAQPTASADARSIEFAAKVTF